MSRSRRPSVSIYDYPEHLNPFNDDIHTPQPTLPREGKSKDSKHKFWTFGRSRKKRSNSFSIKSTWNGLFGKRKDDKLEAQEKRSTITTGISVKMSFVLDKLIFNVEFLSSLVNVQKRALLHQTNGIAARRKYTLDNSPSRYGSSLTVNGDPARIYDGSPQDTTTSIMGDLTPKPPARRFGQVSPKPTDKIPALNYERKNPNENGSVTLRDKTPEKTPVPPLRRFGNRASQRTNTGTVDSEEDANRSGDATMCDENENVPGEFMFKRCSQDAYRRSNLSINSCISVGSTMSSYGRKKRRAPEPPRRAEKVETNEKVPEVSNIELQIVEPIDIARVTENIDQMTKKSEELEQKTSEVNDKSVVSTSVEAVEEKGGSTKTVENNTGNPFGEETCTEEDILGKEQSAANASNSTTNDEERTKKDSVADDTEEPVKRNEEDIQIEYRRTSQENIEIIKDVDQVNSLSELDDVCLRRKSSSGTSSRSDSFSVKDEIEKIERQIKALETRNASRESSEERNANSLPENTRHSIQENRRHFFQNMVENGNDKGAIKIEFKEFPREQKDIHVVRLNDSPVPIVASREPVKVIELHISEPIRQKAEILEDVNPIPKPRRHSALNLNDSQIPNEARRSLESTRGKSF
ncbi:hypothetical protein WH47_06387 [Habropoda laboriosa]|uniref:Uncharacterized protein n=1 Tax=Habropoda laboriosa TaxID=597456 RepID=A0A0L7RCW4_9HYME|nr:hypothetical protein WH47_06387 [Habropoda laboriosa]